MLNSYKNLCSTIIDIHTHAFPDKIAPKIIGALTQKYKVDNIYPCTLDGLLDIMKKIQIRVSVIQIYANSPDKVRYLNEWGANISSINKGRIFCFGTIHPDMENPDEELDRIVKSELKGIKFQPTAQRFSPDERRMFKIYEKISQLKLPILFHAGEERKPIDKVYAPPKSFVQVLSSFPKLVMILAHLGGYKMWSQINALVEFKNAYFDTAAVNSELKKDTLKNMIEYIGVNRIMFGSDFPWFDYNKELLGILNLDLSKHEKAKILYQNACKIIGIKSNTRKI